MKLSIHSKIPFSGDPKSRLALKQRVSSLQGVQKNVSHFFRNCSGNNPCFNQSDAHHVNVRSLFPPMISILPNLRFVSMTCFRCGNLQEIYIDEDLFLRELKTHVS